MSLKKFGTGSLAAVAVTTVCLVPATADAFYKQGRQQAPLELAASAGPAARTSRLPTWGAPPRAAAKAHRLFTAEFGRAEAMWDAATGVPLRLWAMQRAVPKDITTPLAAERTARELLARHIDLLAPGARPDDFVLAADDLSSDIRSVGFFQHYKGRRVLGGQVSFRFKHGRLAMIGSEALPHVRAVLTDSPVAPQAATARAVAWVQSEAGVARPEGAVEGPFILPIVDDGQVREYREVFKITVAAERPIGKFAVYVDAATGEPVAREQLLRFASGVLLIDAPVRGPTQQRVNWAGANMSVFVNGAPTTSDAAGNITFVDGGPAALVTGVSGAFISVQNDAGPPIVGDLLLPPGGATLWAAPADEQLDAQLSAYVHADRVKQLVRQIAPDFAFLDEQMPTRVNIADICNAFADGTTINFFQSDFQCENTARIADVVYHEFGHNVHLQGVIPGVGFPDGALSEGISDFLSATIVDDPGVAPGFFNGSLDPLRQLDPPGSEWHFPEDNGEVHDGGRIIGGALWDLRKALRNKLGAGPGVSLINKMWFESIRRAVDMPTMYPEVLLVDDDDGDLANGTPNECEINVAFDVHGLVGPSAFAADVLAGAPNVQSGLPVDLVLGGAQKACLDLTPTGAELHWRVRDSDASGVVPMVPSPAGFGGVVPSPGEGRVVEYSIELHLSGGASVFFPKNAADPEYEAYFGPVTPIFCTGFESSPQAEGWSVGGEWQWGAPAGGSDPDVAKAGGGVAGTALAPPGTYAAFSSSAMLSPVIAVTGFPTVRLQMQRWLEVEDATFDQARVTVNGSEAWSNAFGFDGTLQHVDGEWRFQDIDITQLVVSGQVQLGFDLSSDDFLEFGGWNLDELCIVGTNMIPPSGGICGDGLLSGTEQCDNGTGNSDTVPDACRSNCALPRCGDFVVDSTEQCDDGNAVAGDGCGATCALEFDPNPTTGPTSDTDTDTGDTDDSAGGDGDLVPHGCACDGGGDAPGAAALLLAGLLGLRRRRSRPGL